MLDILITGKWFMVPLMACSILAIAVLIDRAWAFTRHRNVDNRALRSQLLELLREGRLEEAILVCANTPGPVSAVLLSGLQAYARHRDLRRDVDSLTNVMDKAMDDYSLHALSAVGKRLNVLSTIGNAAPLLGMAGTVTGMIAAFAGLAEAGVAAETVAIGIKEALVTTATGLIIALIAVIPYNVFSGMTDEIELEIEEASSELLDFVATEHARG